MKRLALTVSVLALFAGPALAREEIRIVGSTVIHPFTVAVGEAFSKANNLKAPVVEDSSTSAGIKMFCSGVGDNFPDFANASRRMKKAEFDECAANGVTEIVEVKIGFGGVAFVQPLAAKDFALTKKQLFQALAKDVPGTDGKLAPNPYKMWSEIDPALPATPIKVFGPAPGTGTYDGFLELIMDDGALEYQTLASLAESDEAAFKAAVEALREDGVYIKAEDREILTDKNLLGSLDAVGIVGFSLLETNEDKVKGMVIDDIQVSYDSIADGSYAASKPLWLYGKKQHMGIVPGFKEFLDEYVSDNAMSLRGYLAELGLVALSSRQATKIRANVSAGCDSK